MTSPSLIQRSVVIALFALSACTETLIVEEGMLGGGPAPSPDAGPQADGSAPDAGDPDAGDGGNDELPPSTPWPGNPDTCPATLQEHASACDVSEGEICAYETQDSTPTDGNTYNECACRAFCGSSGPTLKWDCYRTLDLGPTNCPSEQPEDGSSCFGLKGISCYYPSTTVECACPRVEDDSSWRCESDTPVVPEPPSTVDADKLVRDLSDEERAAWCAWYVPPVEPGFPEPEVLEPDAEGFYPIGGCNTTTQRGCNLSRPNDLPAAACEANLALSSCEATVSELNDCVLTMRWSFPAPNGCAHYIAKPGCAGTLVNDLGDITALDEMTGEACRVRVR